MKVLRTLVFRSLIGIFSFLARTLSLPAAEALGGRLGRWGGWIDRRHRRVAYNNLAAAFPSAPREEIASLARAVFEHLGRNLFEILGLSPSVTPEEILGRVRFEGLEKLRWRLQEGKGVLMVTAHLGNWELLGIALSAAGIPLAAIARPLDDPRFNRKLLKIRTRLGMEVIPKRNSLHAVIRRLRDNGVVGFLVDQNVRRSEGVFVPFFGRQACTGRSVAVIARKTGAEVVPIFIRRLDDRHHRIVIGEAIPTPRTADADRDILEHTRAITAVVEKAIRESPAEWLWMHRRWKTRPEG